VKVCRLVVCLVAVMMIAPKMAATLPPFIFLEFSDSLMGR